MKVLRTLERTPLQEGPDFAFWCPGCEGMHVVWVKLPNPMVWTFKGTVERPTFEPSLRIECRHSVPPVTPENLEEWRRAPWKQVEKVDVCHIVITDGVLNFQPDCTHSLAGKSVPMVDVGP